VVQSGAQSRAQQSQPAIAITLSLGQIAPQTYEIAEALRRWLDGRDCLAVPLENAPWLEESGTLIHAEC
jgi:hypothetical protein